MNVSPKIKDFAFRLGDLFKKLWLCSKPVLIAAFQKSKQLSAAALAEQKRRSFSVTPSNAQIIGSRELQEDSLACSDFFNRSFVRHAGYLAIIADGMGGHAHGEEASRAAVAGFLKAYEAKTPNETIPAALQRSLQAAQQAARTRGEQLGAKGNFGTTIVAVVCHESMLYWISVGDSRAYLIRAGKAQQLTTDHTFAAKLEQEMRANQRGATEVREHPKRDHLMSYLGGDEIAEIDINAKPFSLQSGDVVLLCTDGVYRALDSNELSQLTVGNDIADSILSAVSAKKLPSQDNASIVALRVNGSVIPMSIPTKLKVSPVVLFWALLIGLVALIWFLSHEPSPTSVPNILQAEPNK